MENDGGDGKARYSPRGRNGWLRIDDQLDDELYWVDVVGGETRKRFHRRKR